MYQFGWNICLFLGYSEQLVERSAGLFERAVSHREFHSSFLVIHKVGHVCTYIDTTSNDTKLEIVTSWTQF